MIHSEKFINDAKNIHNDKFDYSKFIYVNAKTKSIIVCPIHGEFLQNPDKHLNSKYGCKECAHMLKEKPSRAGIPIENGRISSADYEVRFKHIHGDKFNLILDNFNGLTKNNISIICPTHGIMHGSPTKFLISEYGCVGCSNEQRAKNKTECYESVIQKLKTQYKQKYDYPITNKELYVNKKSKITIICNEHGVFYKSAQKHIAGQGCFHCRIKQLIEAGQLLGGYSEKYFQANSDKINTDGCLYYLKVGKLYKIGITTNIKNRIKSISSKANNSIDLLLIKDYNLYDAFTLEQKILNDNVSNRVFRKWSTELFDVDITNNISQYFYKE